MTAAKSKRTGTWTPSGEGAPRAKPTCPCDCLHPGFGPICKRCGWEPMAGRGLHPAPREMQVRAMSEYLATVPHDLDPVIDLVAYRGMVTLLAGPQKAGKTTLIENAVRALRDDAMHPFLGAWQVARNVPVLWLSEEGAVTIARNLGHLDVDVVSRRDPVPAGWEMAELVDECGAWLRGHRGGLVIVDTYQSWAGVAEENDVAENVKAIQALHPLAEAGAAVLLVHHTRKGHGEYGEGIRGSGAILGAVDHAVELKYIRSGDPMSTRRHLELHGRISDTERYTLDFETGSRTYRLVDDAAEVNAALLASLEGIPRDGEGVTRQDLEELWGVKDGRKRIDDLMRHTLLRRSDERTGTASGQAAWHYWRADLQVQKVHRE